MSKSFLGQAMAVLSELKDAAEGLQLLGADDWFARVMETHSDPKTKPAQRHCCNEAPHKPHEEAAVSCRGTSLVEAEWLEQGWAKIKDGEIVGVSVSEQPPIAVKPQPGSYYKRGTQDLSADDAKSYESFKRGMNLGVAYNGVLDVVQSLEEMSESRLGIQKDLLKMAVKLKSVAALLEEV